MIAGHPTILVTWNGRDHVATGEREHVIGRSVPDRGDEKGVVASWSFDGETLTVEGDRFGHLPLYVAAFDSSIVVGTSPLAVVAAGAPGEVDREAVGLFLRLGFYLGERTPFRHVRLAPRGKRLTWSRGVATVDGTGTPVVPALVRSSGEGVDAYCELFRTAMRRRPPTSERFGMPLSGGRDSRMLLLESLALGHRPDACINLSSGRDSAHPDAVIARQVARRANVPLVTVEPKSSQICSVARKHVNSGLLSAEHSWLMPLWDALRATYSCWYDGLGAGVLTRSDLCSESCRQKYERGEWMELLREISTFTFAVPERAIDRFGPLAEWIETSDESAVALLREEFDRHKGAANPLTRFGFMNWGARGISVSPFMLCAPVRDVHTPFMDVDLVTYLLGYPIELALKDDLQTACLRRMHPTFADIPFDKDLPKAPRTSRPIGRVIAERFTTTSHIALRRSRFRALGVAAALKGDARNVAMLTLLEFLERASTQAGAVALLDEFGFGSQADRAALERRAHAIR